MNVEFVTKDDLKSLEDNIVNKIIERLKKEKIIEYTKKWIKTKDLEELFGISTGKQQKLRNAQEIPFTFFGTTIYYSLQDIDQILEANKTTVKHE